MTAALSQITGDADHVSFFCLRMCSYFFGIGIGAKIPVETTQFPQDDFAQCMLK